MPRGATGLRALVATLTLTVLPAPATAAGASPATSGPVHLDRAGERWAEKTLRKLSAEAKVGQLFMIWARARFFNTDGPDYGELRDRVRRYHIGSVAMSVPVEAGVLLKTGPYEAAMLLNRLQDGLEPSPPRRRGLRARRLDPPLGQHGIPPRHGLRSRRAGRSGRGLRPDHRPGSARGGRPLELLSRGRRQLQPEEPDHQHALLRRRPRARGRDAGRAHPRGARGRPPHYREALPRPRRHRQRLALRGGAGQRRPGPPRGGGAPSLSARHRGWRRLRHGRARHRPGSGTRPEPGVHDLAPGRDRAAEEQARLQGPRGHGRAGHGGPHRPLPGPPGSGGGRRLQGGQRSPPHPRRPRRRPTTPCSTRCAPGRSPPLASTIRFERSCA